MPDGSITISTELDNAELEKQYEQTKRKITSLEDQIYSKKQQRMALLEQADQLVVKLDAAKATLYQMQTSGSAQPQIQQQKEIITGMQSQWDQLMNSADRYTRSISTATVEVDRQKTKAGGLVQKIVAAGAGSNRMAEATERAKESMTRFKSRLAAVVRSALIFTVITRALASLRTWLGKVIKANPEAAAAIARLKGALLTLAQPLLEVVIPAFIKFVNFITIVITKIAQVMSAIFGKTIGQSSKAAQALNAQTGALEGTGKAAKKAAKSLAAFDEINALSDGNGDGGEYGVPASPDFSGIGTEQTQEYKNKIDEITAYVSGALLALGAILLFSGANIPLGLGLLIAGGIGLASVITENWGAMDGKVQGAVNSVLSILGAAGLAIGAVLAFTGANIPLGIGLMAVGAASLATVVALNWGTIKQKLQGPVGGVTALISGALLALGAILAFTGTLPLGIALMAAGAVGLATVTALNWDTIISSLRGPVGGITALISGALLALGAVLAFTGNLPLGIGLMAAGAIGLAAVAVLNGNTIKEKLQGPIGVVTGLVGGALLALGAILTFTGANIPLGIGLMVAGGGALAAAIAPNWDAILDKLKEAWTRIKTWLTNDLGPGVSKFFKGLWFGIQVGVLSMVNFVINCINAMIEGILFPFNALIAGLNKIPGVDIPRLSLEIPRIKLPELPALATGAVIPPNREFMALLGDQKSGTNIEAPEALLRKIYREEGGGDMTLNQTIVLDGEVVYRNQKKVSRRHGPLLVT